jgi:hypothetical protein
VAPRRRRDLVAWVALGLAVATALTLVARASFDPQTGRGRTTSADTRGHTTTSTPVAQLTKKDPAHRDLPIDTTARTLAESPTTAVPRPVPTTPATIVVSTEPSTTDPTTTTSLPRPASPAAPDRSASHPTATAALAATNPGVSGVLRDPDDIATTLPFTSPSGLAAVRALWQGGATLEVTLRCGAAATSGTGKHGISLVVAGQPGSCSVSIGLTSDEIGTVDYTLDIQVPSADSPSPTTR